MSDVAFNSASSKRELHKLPFYSRRKLFEKPRADYRKMLAFHINIFSWVQNSKLFAIGLWHDTFLYFLSTLLLHCGFLGRNCWILKFNEILRFFMKFRRNSTWKLTKTSNFRPFSSSFHLKWNLTVFFKFSNFRIVIFSNFHQNVSNSSISISKNRLQRKKSSSQARPCNSSIATKHLRHVAPSAIPSKSTFFINHFSRHQSATHLTRHRRHLSHARHLPFKWVPDECQCASLHATLD